MEKREVVTLWFIRDTEDTTFHSVAFKSEQEAQQAINETELFETHEPYSVEFPVRYDDDVMDREARKWVGAQYEGYYPWEWRVEDCWEFVEANHHGGRGNFILMTLLDRPHTL